MSKLINTTARILSFRGGLPSKGGVTLGPGERVDVSPEVDANIASDRTLHAYIADGSVIDALETFKGAVAAPVVEMPRPSRPTNKQPETSSAFAELTPPTPIRGRSCVDVFDEAAAVALVEAQTDLELLKTWHPLETRAAVRAAIEAVGNRLFSRASA